MREEAVHCSEFILQFERGEETVEAYSEKMLVAVPANVCWTVSLVEQQEFVRMRGLLAHNMDIRAEWSSY